MLSFSHSIQFIVEDSNECIVKLSVNNQIHFEKTYSPGEHFELVTFSHDYEDGAKNTMMVQFNSPVETAKKHVIIKSVIINGTKLSVLNALYEPQINIDWWNSLSTDDISMYEGMIHGNCDGHYGWYGDIQYEYFTGVSSSSMYISNNLADRLMTRKTEWVLQNKKKAEVPWR